MEDQALIDRTVNALRADATLTAIVPSGSINDTRLVPVSYDVADLPKCEISVSIETGELNQERDETGIHFIDSVYLTVTCTAVHAISSVETPEQADALIASKIRQMAREVTLTLLARSTWNKHITRVGNIRREYASGMDKEAEARISGVKITAQVDIDTLIGVDPALLGEVFTGIDAQIQHTKGETQAPSFDVTANVGG